MLCPTVGRMTHINSEGATFLALGMKYLLSSICDTDIRGWEGFELLKLFDVLGFALFFGLSAKPR